MSALIRNYVHADQAVRVQLVRGAWSDLALRLPGLTANADASAVIVAELGGQVVGAVGYVGAHQPKPELFQADWSIVRPMSVPPQARGHGVRRTLLKARMNRARRDHCALIALHQPGWWACRWGRLRMRWTLMRRGWLRSRRPRSTMQEIRIMR